MIWLEVVYTVLISACHRKDVSLAELQQHVAEKVQARCQGSPLFTAKTRWLINPAGAWHLGAPAADTRATLNCPFSKAIRERGVAIWTGTRCGLPFILPIRDETAVGEYRVKKAQVLDNSGHGLV